MLNSDALSKYTPIHHTNDASGLKSILFGVSHLINLIKNARENEATCITLSAGISPTDRPYLRVSDNGTGIEPDVLERIFVPLFTTKSSGSGIGLTISRQIMHQHNGNITVSSQPGEGSTFTLLFPSI